MGINISVQLSRLIFLENCVTKKWNKYNISATRQLSKVNSYTSVSLNKYLCAAQQSHFPIHDCVIEHMSLYSVRPDIPTIVD